jgi:hypothetical protein
MKNQLCLITAILLLLAFPAVNLFLPYALLVLGLFIGLGYLCGLIRRHSRGAECPLGFC